MKPKIIAICGAPDSGKSTLQSILQTEYGIRPVDDGEIIRRHVMQIMGLTHDDVYTQSGKLKHTEFCGRFWQHREALGDYGNLLEKMFGPDAIPEIALRGLNASNPDHKSVSILPESTVSKSVFGYSFGSVRREQGRVYKKYGGIVVEVLRPGVLASGFDFDDYDKSLVDIRIINDGKDASNLIETINTSGLGDWMGI